MRGIHTNQGRGASTPYYSPTAIFNTQLAANAPLAVDQTFAHGLANQFNYMNPNCSTFYGYSGPLPDPGPYGQAWGYAQLIQYYSYSHPIWKITTPNHARTKVTYIDINTGLPQPAGQSFNLQSYLNSVPVPLGISPTATNGGIAANGGDYSACIWDATTDEMWEFWGFSGTPEANNCKCWFGGYIPNVSRFNGVLPNNWGSKATSLGEIGGLITMQDLLDVYGGRTIEHALCVVARTATGQYTAPATRADGGGGTDAVNEGIHCRFPASASIASLTYTGATVLAQAIAKAVRDYGVFVADSGGACALQAEPLNTLGTAYQTVSTNPYALFNNDGQFETPGCAVTLIKWENLQLLQPGS